MAEEAATNEETPQPKKKNKMLPVIIALALAGAGGGYFMMKKAPAGAEDQAEEKSEGKHGKKSEEKSAHGKKGKEGKEGEGGELIALDPFIINLADSDANRYLKITFAVEVEGVEGKEGIKKKGPILRDRVIMLVSTLFYQDVRTVEGKNMLKEQIVAKLREEIGEKSVGNIYFVELVVQ